MEDYLGRDASPLSEEFWKRLDEAVVETAKETLTARRFLPLYGPLGPGVQVAPTDSPVREEKTENGFTFSPRRSFVEVPQLSEDLWLLWRDLEAAEREGQPADLSSVHIAVQALCRREDQMVFYGVKSLGVDGLLTVSGVNKLKRGDWGTGEGAFIDIVSGVSALQQKGRMGRHTLIVSPDLFVQLHHIQQGTGLMEIERVRHLLEGRIFQATVLQPGTALLLCAQPQYMDLLVGQDIRTAYTEQVELNHHLRILETALPDSRPGHSRTVCIRGVSGPPRHALNLLKLPGTHPT